MSENQARVFISHAATDKDLASAVVSLLKEVGVTGADIFCTSLAGHKVPAGKDFKMFIREQLRDSDVVIALISKNYLDSAFCLCEVGAVWITATKHFFPLVVPPAKFSDFDGALHGTQGMKIDASSDLSELRDCLKSLLGSRGCSTPMWDESRDSFLSKLPAIIASLPNNARIPAAEHVKVLGQLGEYKNDLLELKKRFADTLDECEKIKSLKDQAEVRKISNKFKSQEDELMSTIDQARQTVSSMPLLIREALFHWMRGEIFMPDYQQWGEDAAQEVQRGRLRGSGSGFEVDEEDPQIEDATSALSELRTFIDEKKDELDVWYKEMYRERLDYSLRPFWSRWFKLSS